MNEFANPETENLFDPQLLDRLVDGELSESERRSLLDALEQQPRGWRQCALAFLEARSWGESLSDYVRKPAADKAGESPARSESAATAAQRNESRPGSRFGGRMGWLAMAASFLVTFSLGMLLQRAWRPAAEIGQPSPYAVAPAAAPTGGGLQTVKLAVEGTGGGEQTVEVPLVDGSQLGEAWLREQMPAIPSQVRAALERSGHEIQQQRAYWPIELKDGRRALVPVDQIEVRPVGNRTIQ
jgi:hypothetical protein